MLNKFASAIVLLGVTCAASVCHGQADGPVTEKPVLVVPNIRKGNLKTAASLSLSGTTRTGRQTSFFLSANSQLFLVDHFSLGIDFSVERGVLKGDKVVSLAGPAATYFFLESNQLGAYVELRAQMGFTDATIQGRYIAGAGLEYFITPSVAIGPSFLVNYSLRKAYPNYWSYGVYANFGIYL